MNIEVGQVYIGNIEGWNTNDIVELIEINGEYLITKEKPTGKELFFTLNYFTKCFDKFEVKEVGGTHLPKSNSIVVGFMFLGNEYFLGDKYQFNKSVVTIVHISSDGGTVYVDFSNGKYATFRNTDVTYYDEQKGE